MDLYKIKNPDFLKQYNISQLKQLANQIREFIIENVSKTGGHLSSNLGTVELIIALHKFFDAKYDQFLFDVGHQAYTHKILTGRAKDFPTLRKLNGLSGFLKCSESSYDVFESGHSSTSISTAIGMAKARDFNHETHEVIAIIGDASIANGIAFEALNNLVNAKTKVIIILNDNDMSISKSVGSLAKSLAKIRTTHSYRFVKDRYISIFSPLPFGKSMISFTKKGMHRIRMFFRSANIFDALNINYIGPVNGHDFKSLQKAFLKAKHEKESILIHVKTIKGYGYEKSELDQEGYWHGVSPFNLEKGTFYKNATQRFSSLFANEIACEMSNNPKIVLISAAMTLGTAMQNVFKQYPQRCFDVGISEEHAICFANGFALKQYHPIVVMYSTFFQRCYDQIQHDIIRTSSEVVFLIDHAGIVGEDGQTHQGIYDVSFLYPFHNCIIAMPPNAAYVASLLKFALNQKQPVFIRYNKTKIEDKTPLPIEYPRFLKYNINSQNIAIIIAVGDGYDKMVAEVQHAIYNIGVVCPIFLKPLDEVMLLTIQDKPIYIYDQTSVYEGVSSAIVKFYNSIGKTINQFYCVPNQNIEHGSIEDVLELYSLTAKQVFNKIIGDLFHGKEKN